MAYKQFSTIMTMWNSHAFKSNAILAKSFYKCMSSSATANNSLSVGFVGLGNMGARMANNLIKKVKIISRDSAHPLHFKLVHKFNGFFSGVLSTPQVQKIDAFLLSPL